jgi:ABC-type multidrug transport system ATPase subunit
MTALVQFDSVRKRYGSRTVIDDLSFSVGAGGVTGLLGPNGAGKSTAMRLMLSIAHADGGSIALFGCAPGSAGYRKAIRRVGALVEEPALYDNASGRDNLELQAVGLGISRRDPRLGRLLDQVGLSARGGDRVKKYSLGMRQRLALALALVNEPELVILDEPTNGLDPAGVVEIRELVRALPAAGTTVLVSSHVLAEIQRTADHLVIIDQGRLVADGTIDDVIAGAGSTGYVVRIPEPQRVAAIAALQSAGLSAGVEADGSLLVSGEIGSGSQIARALAAADLYPDELRQRGIDLEAAFLSVTGGATGDTGSAARS